MTLTAEQIARNKIIRAQALRDAEEFVRSHIWALEDNTILELVGLFQSAFEAMSQKLLMVFLNQVPGEAWSSADSNFRQRTEALLAQINAQITDLLAAAQDTAFATAYQAMQAGAAGRAWVLDLGLRGAADALFPLLPSEAIRAAILAPYNGLTFLDRFANARAEFEQTIRRSIVASQIAGEGIGPATRRLAAALGVQKDMPKSLRARLEMITRTEVLRASNQGALATYEANKDVLMGWEWIATKDERTCPICGALDGQAFKFGAAQSQPPAHPRCRCSILPTLANSALEAAIAGPRETYQAWAARRGVSVVNDGGVLKFRGTRPPKSNTPAATAAAPQLYPRGA